MNLKELARKAVSTLFLSMLCLVAFAQTATGLVKDKTGEPMIGVNVLVKGTTNGTITDFDGKFSIPDVPSNATLVVSYIGYLTKEVKTGKDLVIVLEEDNKTLDEVVVIGYGTVKRRDLTGSVASVTGEKLAANPGCQCCTGFTRTIARCECDFTRRSSGCRYVYPHSWRWFYHSV